MRNDAPTSLVIAAFVMVALLLVGFRVYWMYNARQNRVEQRLQVIVARSLTALIEAEKPICEAYRCGDLNTYQFMTALESLERLKPAGHWSVFEKLDNEYPEWRNHPDE